MKQVLIVVEGQTEERFVKDVLRPELAANDVHITPTIVVTKIVKSGPNFKGGLYSFSQFQEHLNRVLAGSGGILVTSMIDYYGLPADFPGMRNRPIRGTARQRAQHVQNSLASVIDKPNFLPFISLHEFEAWLFSDSESVPSVLTALHKQQAFAAIAESMPPEEINDGPNTAPSKRILSLFPAYRKVLHGPSAANRIGISTIRQRCPHFAAWMDELEA